MSEHDDARGENRGLTPEEIAELKELHELYQTPIDFDTLIDEGILERRGAWYRVLDFERLPDHAKVKINARKPPDLVQFEQ